MGKRHLKFIRELQTYGSKKSGLKPDVIPCMSYLQKLKKNLGMASEVNIQFSSLVLSLLACQFFQKKLGRLPISHLLPGRLGNNWPVNLSESGTFLCFFKNLFIYLFIYLFIGCIGSSLLCVGFLQLRRAGATLCSGVRASHCGGFSLLPSTGFRHVGCSSCGMWAQQLWHAGSRVQAQQLWHTVSVAPRHVGSFRTRARTRVP